MDYVPSGHGVHSLTFPPNEKLPGLHGIQFSLTVSAHCKVV